MTCAGPDHSRISPTARLMAYLRSFPDILPTHARSQAR